ncbi:hypothetical protein IG631_08330 [Alternaria alternata]|nr:hypothetical protein IG631_08330 [Alternaria alternata]
MAVSSRNPCNSISKQSVPWNRRAEKQRLWSRSIETRREPEAFEDEQGQRVCQGRAERPFHLPWYRNERYPPPKRALEACSHERQVEPDTETQYRAAATQRFGAVPTNLHPESREFRPRRL